MINSEARKLLGRARDFIRASAWDDGTGAVLLRDLDLALERPVAKPRPLLDKTALHALADIAKTPLPRSRFEIAMVRVLLREDLVCVRKGPDPDPHSKGIAEYLHITNAGRAVIAPVGASR